MDEIILGIDPGTACTGYGLITRRGNQLAVISYGVIRTKPKEPNPQRYYHIFNELEKIILKYKPVATSIETQYVDKNVQSALKLGMARCAATLASVKNGLPVFEYAPSKAKIAITGKGNASKHQVQQMTLMLLNLKEPPPEDAADALALAICHCQNRRKLHV
ncbi:MAG: crossover junction endodeoxyribonuclease RuvC [Simkaniaceae bacterium]|nr:crossover junction endodeoxyribonuclease RuvC [Simkaniaceae bacterium]